jgi:L-ribulose-5-phosphate 4-epimerase
MTMPGRELRELVAQSCRILNNEGQEHFHLGHVSAREPGSSLICVKPSALGLQEIEPEHLLELDLAGNRVEGDRPIHHEMPIHTAIYTARPDVNAVVHTHPFFAAAFSAASAEFKMVSQDSVQFAGGIGFYPSAKLVVTQEQGTEMAKCLGSHDLVVLKNHGIAVGAKTVQDATFLAVSFDRSIRMQLTAMQLGPVNPISDQEVAEATQYFDKSYGGRVRTTWEYLLRKMQRSSQG